MSKKKPSFTIRGRLLEIGQHEHYDVPSLKIRLVGHPEPIVTIPCTQKVVITMAPFLYENVKITVEAA